MRYWTFRRPHLPPHVDTSQRSLSLPSLAFPPHTSKGTPLPPLPPSAIGTGSLCHGSAGTPLGTHAGREALGLQDARTTIRT
jgi:hypothetical protein